MSTESKVRLVSRSAPPAEGFNATLMGVTLADLIQMKCLSGATEGVRISSSGQIGVLQFTQGQLTHAVTADLFGESAVLELLKWKTGDCAPFSTPLPPNSGVRHPWQSLLLASAQAADESLRDHDGSPPEAGRTFVDLGGNTPTPVRSKLVSVRLSHEGQVLSTVGAAEDLSAVTAYALHMANHIGDRLGLDVLKGCELRGGESRTVLVVETNGEVCAVQSTIEADVAGVRARAGL